MKSIHLAYGKTGLDVEVDPTWHIIVVEPEYVAGISEPLTALREALRNPLRSFPLAERVKPGNRVGIIINDITRATPTPLILEAIFQELVHIPAEAIVLFNALGTHRANTDAELRRMLGDNIVDRYRIVQNDCGNKASQVFLGQTSRESPIWINRELIGCDFRILTGFIEPHFFAGFSGGGKAIMPGMAGLETILCNHNAVNIGDPRATWGITQGNPLWEEVHEVAMMARADFLCNVTLNRDKEITGVFAGDLDAAHIAGCNAVRDHAMVGVEAPFDIVVTSNSGYPLDLNLYQSVKGMSAAAQVVRQGGKIIMAAECWDGIPDHGLFGEMLREVQTPQELLERIQTAGMTRQDQWQAQVMAQIMLKEEVYVHSSFLNDEQIQSVMLKPARDITATLRQLVEEIGPDARICFLPEGPVTIPYVRNKG